MLVSTTDLRDRVLCGKPALIAVSGFAKQERPDQPHNPIRRPDMPREAFRDLWQTIADGRPWSAPLKNRRKDGSHHRVMADVTPLMLDGAPAGHMSVRTEPTREQVTDAEAPYKTMRQEQDGGRLLHRLQAGRVALDTASARLRRRLGPGLRGRVALVGATSGLLTSLVATVVAGQALQAGSALAALVAGAALCALAGAWVAARWFIAPLQRLLVGANRMAAGDLTQSIAVDGAGPTAQLSQALAQPNVNLRSRLPRCPPAPAKSPSAAAPPWPRSPAR